MNKIYTLSANFKPDMSQISKLHHDPVLIDYAKYSAEFGLIDEWMDGEHGFLI